MVLCAPCPRAVQGNAADVSAKEGSQETAVTLVGMVLGLLAVRVTDQRPLLAWGVFLSLTAAHVYCNMRAVRALVLRTPNTPRLRIVAAALAAGRPLPSPAAANAAEPLLPPPVARLLRPWAPPPPYAITLGVRVGHVASDLAALWADEQYASAMAGRGYLVVPARDGASCRVVLRADNVDSATAALSAWIHAAAAMHVFAVLRDPSAGGEPRAGRGRGVRFPTLQEVAAVPRRAGGDVRVAAVAVASAWMDRHAGALWRRMAAQGWRVDARAALEDAGYRATWGGGAPGSRGASPRRTASPKKGR
ncbi:unnamed protein product [Pedinophyceae sp. YPF-701]|nr:unnamed protein product [Pedinophyceae sp. YPF-701]